MRKKPFIYPFTGQKLLQIFREEKTRAIIARIVLLAFCVQIVSCNYSRIRPELPPYSDKLSTLAKDKLFILHHGNNTYSFIQPVINGEFLEGYVAQVANQYAKYANPGKAKAQRYKRVDRDVALNFVHLYINEYAQGQENRISIPISSIKRIDVVEHDSGRTTFSAVVGTLGVLVAIVAILSIIVALTKSSCPFIYSYNGQNYEFVGEAYGGAIFSPLERGDYMPIPQLKATQGRYHIRIVNELKERQFTNQTQLWLATHPVNTEVLLDHRGNPQLISQPKAPVTAYTSAGEEMLPQILRKDSASCLFNEDLQKEPLNALQLTFTKPAGANKGKLILRAKNSLWMDYLFGEYTKKFGSYYNTWASKQKTKSFKELNEWQENQAIPLNIYLQTTTGWELVESIPSVGPLAARDIVVPIQLTKVATNQPIRIKLSTGFMFWEVDYAAIDFSANESVNLQKCELLQALNENGKDETLALQEDDQKYLIQLHPNNSVTLTFKAPEIQSPSMTYSTFLFTKGYYEHVREYEGFPELLELYSFKKPGRFTQFSQEKYMESLQGMNLATVKK